MSVWDADTISRFAQQGEDLFAVTHKCIVQRVALSIVANTSEYTLSDSVIDIRKITWLGRRIDPIPFRQWKDDDLPLNSTGRPDGYIYNNIGQQKIKFYPTPDTTIASTSSNLFGSEIANRVIVEYYSTPDYSTIIIPSFIRRRLIKCYVAKMCFSIESKGQNLKAARYFSDKWDHLMERYGQGLQDLINKPRRLIASSTPQNNRIPRPRLNPSNFGVGVDF